MNSESLIEWFELCSVEDARRIFKIGTLKKVKLEGTDICFGRSGLGFFALKDECPHEKIELSKGELLGTSVVCPWHHYRFDVRNGSCLGKECGDVEIYPIKEESGKVFIGKPKD